MSNLLEALNLEHEFEANKTLYSNVNLELKPAQSICILGVSGSGKSSILNHISTMLAPKNGKLNLLGIKDIYSQKQAVILDIRRKSLGLIFQQHYLMRGFLAEENIKLSQILSKSESKDNSIATKLKIDGVLKQQIGTLSGGQQQRVSIARALIKNPKIIIADEPTGNLDYKTANDVMDVIFSYIKQNDAGLVLATHDMQIAQKCDLVYRLNKGELVLA
ncbi:MAG: ATP-binding cassette domain-containing protein [Helicobacter sp.]|nr:ATP-binding cassette domain-containing protein [Helicobacter sp.]